MANPHPPVVVIAGVSDVRRQASFLPDRYSEAIQRAGGMPLIRPATLGAPDQVSDLLERADAVLIPGGGDLDTQRLGIGPVHPQARLTPPAQQHADTLLAAGAAQRGLPLLGICYGMQLLGVMGGARLHQHLPDDAPGTVKHLTDHGSVEHEVHVPPGTRTAAALSLADGGRLRVHSAHHQALASVGTDWTVTARDEDGLIEAIEHTGPWLAIGVQWHPERGEPSPASDGLFAALVAAARDRSP